MSDQDKKECIASIVAGVQLLTEKVKELREENTKLRQTIFQLNLVIEELNEKYVDPLTIEDIIT